MSGVQLDKGISSVSGVGSRCLRVICVQAIVEPGSMGEAILRE